MLEDEDAAIDELERKLRELDPVALADPNSYWAAIVEQLRHELG